MFNAGSFEKCYLLMHQVCFIEVHHPTVTCRTLLNIIPINSVETLRHAQPKCRSE